jgi:ABC-type Zn uptake system ZnuABC Zn-binding protein ZnuA
MNQLLKILFGSLLFLFAFAGAQSPLKVVVSLHPHYDLMRQLTGDAAEVTRLLPLGASPHTFEPTPQDVLRVAEADLIVMNGGIDEWLLGLVEASGTDAPVLELLQTLEFDPLGGEAHEEEHKGEAPEDEAHEGEAHEHDHSGVNPHLWLDPLLMRDAVPLFVEALSEADPANAQRYTANGEALSGSLEALDVELTEILEPVGDAPFVPFHDAWPYFVARYRLNQVAVLEPSPGREPSPGYIAEVLAILGETGATALFNDVQLPPRPAEVVAESAGLELYTLDPEGGGRDEAQSYQDLMRENARTIADALAP